MRRAPEEEDLLNMDKSKKVKYRLFALRITEENVARAEQARFCRIASEYILIYASGRKPYGSVEVTQNELKRLTANDQIWLQDCNAALIVERTLEKQDEIAADLSGRMDALERELKAEKDKLDGN